MVVLTKMDMSPPEVHAQTLENIKAIVKSPMVKRTPVVFDQHSHMDEIDKWARVVHGNAITPIFNVSSVTGSGLPQLRRFIFMLGNRSTINKAFGKAEDLF
jgi:GTPase